MVLHEKQDLEGLIGTLCDQVRRRRPPTFGRRRSLSRAPSERWMPGEAGWRGLRQARPPPASPRGLFSTSSGPAHSHWLFRAGLPGPTQSSVLRGSQESEERGPGRVAGRPGHRAFGRCRGGSADSPRWNGVMRMAPMLTAGRLLRKTRLVLEAARLSSRPRQL